MDDADLVAEVTARTAAVGGVAAVALGGSRARGEERPDSDWDFAAYYRGELDHGAFTRWGWEGEVHPAGAWGPVMNGGAVFDHDGRHIDVIFRDLDVVEPWVSDAVAGRFSVHILAYHLAGIPTYAVAGELACGRTLHGTLPEVGYPDALAEAAPVAWARRAGESLWYAAAYHARSGQVTGCRGLLARATMETAHGVLAGQRRWVLNEKRCVEQAGLAGVDALLGGAAGVGAELESLCREVRTRLVAALPLIGA